MSKNASAVLVVDGAPMMRRLIGAELEPYGYLVSAAETGRPWISRVTSRALKGEIRAYLCIDLTSIYFKLAFEASTWSRSPTLIFSFPESSITAPQIRWRTSTTRTVAIL